MQAAAGWCGEPSYTCLKSRSSPFTSSIGPRRQSCELGRVSFEAAPCERALSCGALAEGKLAKVQHQKVKSQRGHINAAAAVLVRELEQEAQDSICSDIEQQLQQDADFSQAQRDQLEQDRVRLELAWNKRRSEAEQQQASESGRWESLPEQAAEPGLQKQQRELLVARWTENKQVLPQQKKQNAFSRSTSSRRARRRAQPMIGLAAQRTMLHQSVGARPSRSSSAPSRAMSVDEQLLDRLQTQLNSARNGAVLDFVQSMGKTPVLTKQQETGLTTIVRKGVLLEQKQCSLQDQLGRIPSAAELQAETSCSPAQYNKAVQLAAHGKQLMMRYNLRLVYAIAKNFQNRGLEMDDMLPEGVAGLEKAIEKFEPEKGFKFSTYSHWWIRQHIYRALIECRIIRLPVHIVDSIARIRTAQRQLAEQPDRHGAVTEQELSSVLGLPVAKVKQFMQLSNPIKSLDVPLWQDGDDTHNCVVADQGTSASEDEAVRVQSQDMVEKDMTALLQTLPVRERNVIRWRYGLRPDGKSLGMTEVAAAYGLTHERIRQIEESGLAHLRERSPAHFKS